MRGRKKKNNTSIVHHGHSSLYTLSKMPKNKSSNAKRKAKKAKLPGSLERSKVYGEKKGRVEKKDVPINYTANGEKVKCAKDNALETLSKSILDFVSNEPLPKPIDMGDYLNFNFTGMKKKEFMDTKKLTGVYISRGSICPLYNKFRVSRTSKNESLARSNFSFSKGGDIEVFFVRNVLGERELAAMKILQEIMKNDPTAKVVSGATGGASGVPDKTTITTAIRNFENIGNKSAVKIIDVTVTGTSAKVKYINKHGKLIDYQFGPCLDRHVFGLKANDKFEDFVEEVASRYSTYCGVFTDQMREDVLSLLTKMRTVYGEYASKMLGIDKEQALLFFNKNVKMCLNYMHSGQSRYKDHKDPTTKFPCMLTCIKNCGGGELFLRDYGFMADYKDGDILFLKGDRVAHMVNGLVTQAKEEAERLSLIFFNNEK